MKKKYMALIFRFLIIMIAGYGLARYLGVLQGRINSTYFAYYTVQSNLLVLLYFVVVFFYMITHWEILSSEKMSPFPVVKGGMTYAIIITALVYNLVLVPILCNTGNYKPYGFIDCILHLYVPGLAILDWLLFDRKPAYTIFDPIKWQIIPIIYFLFTICRAEIGGLLTPTSRYPYIFIDIDLYGMPVIMRNAVILLCCFTILAYTFYGIDVLLGKMKEKGSCEIFKNH